MSGITGLYAPERDVDGDALDGMLRRIDHRGPDGSGRWTDGSVGLGHQLLSTTPESRHESLPDATDGFAVTADARLDNRDELLAELDVGGSPDSIPDSRLLLAAYARWGEQCPDHLLGAFAFAVWDESERTLFAARDHMGVKPFYYYHEDGLFAFGSEIKALLALDGVPCRLNEARVGDYLAEALEDETATFYEGIRRLPPAHALRVTPSGLTTREYWSLDPTRNVELNSDEAYADRFRELFTEAVRCRLRSAYPVGSTLSGGLDSSSVVCTAADLLEADRLHTVSAVFPEVLVCDERPYIEAVLDHVDVTSHFVRADQTSPLSEFDCVVWHQDEPFYAPNLFIHRNLYRTAARHDVRVLLDGLDGDSTVSHGIDYLTDLARSGRIRRAVSEARALAPSRGVSTRDLLFDYVVRPTVLSPLRRLRESFRGDDETASIPPLVDSEFARMIDLRQQLDDNEQDSPEGLSSARVSHYEDLTSGLVPYALEVADGAAAEFGLEPRYPFFDRRLVEFCLALPPEQKLRDGTTRFVLHEALAETLPGELYARCGKTSLSANFERNLLKFDRGRLEETILDPPAYLAQRFDGDTLRRQYRQYVAGKYSNALTVWKAATLSLWFEKRGSDITPKGDRAEPRTEF